MNAETNSQILQILDQVANEVSGELDLSSVLRNTAKLIRKVVDYSSFVIGLINEHGEFDLVHQEGYDPKKIDSVRIKADKGIIGVAVTSKEVVIVDDVSGHPQHIMVPTADGQLPKSMIAVPLVSKDRVLGAIGMECTELGCFTGEHRLMMRTIASHLAAAVANAKLYEQTTDQIRLMRIIEQIGQDILSVLDLDQLLSEIARLTKQVIEYQTFGIFLIDRERGHFRPYFSIGFDKEDLRQKPLSLDKGLRGEALRLRRPILANDVQSNPHHVSNKLEIEDVVRSQMYIPLQTPRGVIGILVLGNTRRRFYNSRHLRIAHGMATQVAIALENAKEFEEVVESEEKLRSELEIARSMQLSMLPEHCPIIPGFHIEAQSRPAANVGGDFYDFLELEDGRLGIVIGDVSGYGVSGALVMASAREVLRIYSDLYTDPSEVMHAADKRFRKDLTSHMFVAALYGILDPGAKTFTFCNAGLVEPALIRDGKARFVSVDGVRLPLGKRLGGSYKPRKIQLKAHDLLVFTTDGSVEAYDSKGQPFGFRRYLRVLAAAGDPRSETVDTIGRVFSKLRKFTGGKPLQDDATLLTLKVADEDWNERN